MTITAATAVAYPPSHPSRPALSNTVRGVTVSSLLFTGSGERQGADVQYELFPGIVGGLKDVL